MNDYIEILVPIGRSKEMVSWCRDNIAGYGREVNGSFYFRSGYSWYARRVYWGDKYVFYFANPEDATMFTLRWV